MFRRRVPLLLLLCCCAARVAAAQELELGLDLSEPSTPEEFKPSLAVLGVSTPSEEPLARVRAEKIQAALLQAAADGDPFAKLLEPAEAQNALEPETDRFMNCNEAECLEQAAERLGVQRVAVGMLVFEGGESKLQLWGLDVGRGGLVTVETTSREQALKQRLDTARACLAGRTLKRGQCFACLVLE